MKLNTLFLVIPLFFPISGFSNQLAKQKTIQQPRLETESSDQYQIEVGFQSSQPALNSGTASASITVGAQQFYSKPQELTSSENGFLIGARRNFIINEDYFTSFGLNFNYLSHRQRIDFQFTNAVINRETRTSNVLADQRFGYRVNFDSLGMELRPYFGIGANFQFSETSSTVNSGNGFANFDPLSVVTRFFMVPSLGADLIFSESFGLQLKACQSQVYTPSQFLISGPTFITEGVDLVNTFSVSAIVLF